MTAQAAISALEDAARELRDAADKSKHVREPGCPGDSRCDRCRRLRLAERCDRAAFDLQQEQP